MGPGTLGGKHRIMRISHDHQICGDQWLALFCYEKLQEFYPQQHNALAKRSRVGSSVMNCREFLSQAKSDVPGGCQVFRGPRSFKGKT